MFQQFIVPTAVLLTFLSSVSPDFHLNQSCHLGRDKTIYFLIFVTIKWLKQLLKSTSVKEKLWKLKYLTIGLLFHCLRDYYVVCCKLSIVCWFCLLRLVSFTASFPSNLVWSHRGISIEEFAGIFCRTFKLWVCKTELRSIDVCGYVIWVRFVGLPEVPRNTYGEILSTSTLRSPRIFNPKTVYMNFFTCGISEIQLWSREVVMQVATWMQLPCFLQSRGCSAHTLSSPYFEDLQIFQSEDLCYKSSLFCISSEIYQEFVELSQWCWHVSLCILNSRNSDSHVQPGPASLNHFFLNNLSTEPWKLWVHWP